MLDIHHSNNELKLAEHNPKYDIRQQAVSFCAVIELFAHSKTVRHKFSTELSLKLLL